MFVILILLLLIIANITANICNSREVDYGIVCVCNSTYCDTVPEVEDLSVDQYQIYFTSKSNPGHNTQVGRFLKNKRGSPNIIRVGRKQFQTIIGFGGAFTDATGENIRSLEEGVQQKLLESYFGKNGIEYSLCRVPIGGADFSPRPYSYDDHPGDVELKHFKLQEEDLLYKIPFIKEAKRLRCKKGLKLFASAWTAPPWMKTENLWTGYAFLKPEYYQLWANYAIKFFDEYSKHNIDFWGMTTGNEPMDGFYSHSYLKLNAMGWVPISQAKWISQHLGPSLRNSSHKDLNIMIHDDDRISVPYVVPVIFNDEEALKYISGVAVHWYWDIQVPPDVLELTKSKKKDVFLLSSESCFFQEGVHLGSWERAAGYIGSIIEYLQYDSVGWVDWNMVLNLTGGPTYVGYEADSPIIVNGSAQEFYKQPMFYAMGHFSKFVVPGSVRLDVSHSFLKQDNYDIKSVAFLRPDNLLALIIFNNGSTSFSVQVQNKDFYSSSVNIKANSVYTILYSLKGVDENLTWT